MDFPSGYESAWPYVVYEDVIKAPDGRIIKDRGRDRPAEPVYKTPDDILYAPVTTSEPTR